MAKDSFNLSEFLPDSLCLQAQGSTRYSYKGNNEDPYLKIEDQDPLELLGEIFSSTKPIEEGTIGSPIQECFRGRGVLITGGTGFIGKILIDKLIRSVFCIGHIFLLVRGKKGKTPEERFNNLMEDAVFKRMKTEVPGYARKISVVEGDITLPDLGLSAADRHVLIENVNLIFNSAADVRFAEPLRSAVRSNVLGSKNVLDLAKEVKDLTCFLHVSTAFSHCVLKKIPEKVPRLPVYSYDQVIEIVTSKTDLELEKNMSRIMQGWPNTYTFTKAVCEEMLSAEGKHLPLCIFRPSMVTNTYKEPVKGWTDNLYGPLGVMVAMGLGILHSFPGEFDLRCDLVPVDYAVNCMIAAAWRTYEIRNSSRLTVYNFTASPSIITTWKSTLKLVLKYKDVFPFYSSIYYTSFIESSSIALDIVLAVLFQKIPAKIIDLLFQPSISLSKVYDRMNSLKKEFIYFSRRVWDFEQENMFLLSQSLSKEDKEMFNFNLSDLDPTLGYLQTKLGMRYYILKEDMKTLPAARVKNTCLRWIHFTVKASFYIAALKLLVMAAHSLPV